ncbi:DUF7001 family protein [Halalkalicoccus salilacus]|uniref:DUF7001 family protein n=1 Tax=Halalkalicoccus sp. GCM10025704 TaxID=3252662 RepID=UPI00360EE291
MTDRITLYRAPTAEADVDAIAGWLRERTEREVRVRDRFLDVHRREGLPERFAAARVLDPYDRETGTDMLESSATRSARSRIPNVRGRTLRRRRDPARAQRRASRGERHLSHLHVPLLDRAIATWGDHDNRWHKRVNVLGQPALVSVPGLYEAPAKPEAYYQEKGRHAMLTGDSPPREVLENEIEGDFLIAEDPRTTDALKGYVLQALDYVETGEPFCDDECCRLYNAHRQPELIEAQLREPEFCTEHAGTYETG